VWSSKVEGTEFEPSDEMRWGTWIEQRIVDWWAMETGRSVGAGGLYRSAEHPWMLATPDAVVLELRETPPPPAKATGACWGVVATVDAKVSGWYAADEWEDGAPLDYICQKTQQMLTVGVRRGYLVATIGGRPPVERELALDDDLAGMLIERGSKLWQHICDGTPPPIDFSPRATEWLNTRYRNANPDLERALSAEDMQALQRLREVKRAEKQMKEVREGLENEIKGRLAEAVAGTWNGRTYVTWKEVERRGYTVSAGKYRRLHLTSEGESK
jgi:hypothetical protein